MTDIFKMAKQSITPALIEQHFSTPGAYWSNGEYFTRSPLRDDKNIGSFHISESGIYVDHATGDGGDFVGLIAKSRGGSLKEAAEIITGQPAPLQTADKPAGRKKAKMVPVEPDEIKSAVDELKKVLSGYTKKHGK